MSFMGSVISLDRSSMTSGRISVIQDRLSGLCRLDLRTACGRRLLLLQLLLVPSISLVLLTSLTLWKLAEDSAEAGRLSRFHEAIDAQRQRELVFSSLTDELLATVHTMIGLENGSKIELLYEATDNDYNNYVGGNNNNSNNNNVAKFFIADRIRAARNRFKAIRENDTSCHWTAVDQSDGWNASYAACLEVISGYLETLDGLSLTEESSVSRGLPHEVYSHWYAARSLLQVRLHFVDNCVHGALAIGSGMAALFDGHRYADELDVRYYHILDIVVLDHHLGAIFNRTADAELYRLRSYNQRLADGGGWLADRTVAEAALRDWHETCAFFRRHIFPAMMAEIYDGLDGEGIVPAENRLWSLIGFHAFCLAVQIPVLMFVVQNGRITSVSIFSSVNMFSSRVAEIRKEKHKTEQLLREMLPKSIASQLLAGRRSGANFYDQVTVSFSDIADFNDVSRTSKPVEIVTFLNEIYNFMDGKLECYDVYKVETIGSVYMVASGLPIGNGDRHVTEIASMAIDLIKSSKSFTVSHLPGYQLQLRFGIHTGSCCAGVVGNKMPRYCLFGDTVNTASRMQSSGEALKIQITRATYNILAEKETYVMQERGEIAVKGKGKMITYWLLSEKTAKNLTTDNAVRVSNQRNAWSSDK